MTTKPVGLCGVLLAGAAGAVSAQSASSNHDLTPLTMRASVGSGGGQGNGTSLSKAVSASGRVVAFESFASNLVSGDTNGTLDIFVRDLLTGITERVSVSSAGAQSNGPSVQPSISADGRFVSYYSHATNLVPGDANGYADVFVRDRWSRTTERASVDSAGAEANFESRYNALSADGHWVAFVSGASNLAPGDTNGVSDVFVHDRWKGNTERVSLASSGVQGNSYSDSWVALSADGGVVVFTSHASNLVAGDTNLAYDVFVRDLATGTTECVSIASGGIPGNLRSEGASISADGRRVAFQSQASNLVPGDTNGATDVFVRDRLLGSTERVNVGPAGVQTSGGQLPSISANGTLVAFDSGASNLVAGDSNFANDVFVHDLRTGSNELVSVRSSGEQGHDFSMGASISADGSTVAFHSLAKLVPGDTNGDLDVFVHTWFVSH